MIFEDILIKTKKFNNDIIFVFQKEKAIDTVLITGDTLNSLPGMVAILNKNNEVIGINTLQSEDMYSPRKLQEVLERQIKDYPQMITSSSTPKETSLIKWWNNTIYKVRKNEELNRYEDISLHKDELKKYFINTIETHEDVTWYTYYLNPTGGLSVRINDMGLVDFTSMSIKKIVLSEEKLKDGSILKRIYFYDDHSNWLDDIDIITKLSWDNIFFVISRDNLNKSSTSDDEKQCYIELWDGLDPWMDKDELKMFVRDWFERRGHQFLHLK